MSKFKITKFAFISILFFSIQLGACAEESQEPSIQVTSIQEHVAESNLNEPQVEPQRESLDSTVQTVSEKISVSETSERSAAQEILNLDQYKGKVVYLDFWASWCVPCQQTFPWMDAMQKKYPDDIVFVAVNFGESPDEAQEFLERFPADIKFVYDPLLQIASEYGIPGLPYSFIYGRNGDLLGKHAGFSGGSEINLEAALNNLFATGK